MHFQLNRRMNDSAVSPVVGVMLMLVVTIIIAAVVSAFSGGMAATEQKAPSVTVDTKIVNTGLWQGSGFSMHFLSVSEGMPSSDLKLVTSWTARDGTRGGNTSLPNVINVDFMEGDYQYSAPLGFGPGVEDWGLYQIVKPESHFGNFSITGGTTLRAYPIGPFAGADPVQTGGYGPDHKTYEYVEGTGGIGPWGPISAWYLAGDTDSMQAVLGHDWNILRAGDVVNVKLIHMPSEKVIYDADVPVEGY